MTKYAFCICTSSGVVKSCPGTDTALQAPMSTVGSTQFNFLPKSDMHSRFVTLVLFEHHMTALQLCWRSFSAQVHPRMVNHLFSTATCLVNIIFGGNVLQPIHIGESYCCKFLIVSILGCSLNLKLLHDYNIAEAIVSTCTHKSLTYKL